MSLIRFESSDVRGPTAQLWRGIVDWVRGSLATALGQRDFEDYAPDNSGFETVTSTTGSPTRALQSDGEFGVVNYTEAAGSNECVTVVRHIWFDLDNSPITVVEARVEQIADDDDPIAFVGLFDGTLAFASGTLDGGSNEDSVGLRWNSDETIDIVAVVDGTLSVLKDDIGISVERTDGLTTLGLRIEKMTASQFRLTPAVNGTIIRAGAVNVASSALPSNPMRPCVAQTVTATTAPSFDVDFIYAGSK